MKSVKQILSVAIILAAAFGAKAEVPQEIIDNPQLTAGNLLAYPTENFPELSDAPEGYEPFHIEHYGRHGSRWLLSPRDYSRPLQALKDAHEAGKLTPRGEKALATLERMEADARAHYGELTHVGALQHRGIAQRMYDNFPQVFADSSYVDAKSTVVIRCILSMTNELVELSKKNPKLNITQESSFANQWYLNSWEHDTVAHAVRRKASPILDQYKEGRVNPYPFMYKLFSDKDYVKDNVNVDDFYNKMFELASNQQSHGYADELYDLYTIDELYKKWDCNNADWYFNAGNAPGTNGRMPFMQRHLLADFIASADKAMANPSSGATLRFGHEVVVLPMVCFMELDNYGAEIENLDELSAKWRNYEVFPMASNIQMIFYRNANSGDVLVKCMLNEREVALPSGHVEGPYYSWAKLKEYYQNKLDSFSTRFER